MSFWDKIESSGKKFSSIIAALSLVVVILCKIYTSIEKLSSLIEKLSSTISASQEHTKFIGYQIDRELKEADKILTETGTIPRERLDALLLYRDTLPTIITYKQKLRVDHIERMYYRKSEMRIGGEK